MKFTNFLTVFVVSLPYSVPYSGKYKVFSSGLLPFVGLFPVQQAGWTEPVTEGLAIQLYFLLSLKE